MPQMRVFVSSTAYDLGMVRGQLGTFVRSLGHQVAMSEFSGVLYDPRVHTQKACVQELASCDAVVMIIGSRWGSIALPQILEGLKIDQLDDTQNLLDEPISSGSVSITQLEALTAVREQIPLFVFVDSSVRAEARFYESNLELAEEGRLNLPTMGNAEAAKYVFNFLRYVEARSSGNAVIEFSQIEDIQSHLKTQWSSWLQRLVSDARQARSQQTIVEVLDEKLEDLKAAIVTGIPDADARNVAGGVLEFRVLCEFLPFLDPHGTAIRERSGIDFTTLLNHAGVREVLPLRRNGNMGVRTLVLLQDGFQENVLELRMSPDRFFSLQSDWSSFMQLTPEERSLIYEAIRRDRRAFGPTVRTRSLSPDQVDVLRSGRIVTDTDWAQLLEERLGV